MIEVASWGASWGPSAEITYILCHLGTSEQQTVRVEPQRQGRRLALLLHPCCIDDHGAQLFGKNPRSRGRCVQAVAADTGALYITSHSRVPKNSYRRYAPFRDNCIARSWPCWVRGILLLSLYLSALLPVYTLAIFLRNPTTYISCTLNRFFSRNLSRAWRRTIL